MLEVNIIFFGTIFFSDFLTDFGGQVFSVISENCLLLAIYSRDGGLFVSNLPGLEAILQGLL